MYFFFFNEYLTSRLSLTKELTVKTYMAVLQTPTEASKLASSPQPGAEHPQENRGGYAQYNGDQCENAPAPAVAQVLKERYDKKREKESAERAYRSTGSRG
jgi:Tfp pilus assembly protein FimV